MQRSRSAWQFFCCLARQHVHLAFLATPSTSSIPNAVVIFELNARNLCRITIDWQGSVRSWLGRKKAEQLLCLADSDTTFMVKIQCPNSGSANLRSRNEMVVIPLEMVTPDICPGVKAGDRCRTVAMQKRNAVCLV